MVGFILIYIILMLMAGSTSNRNISLVWLFASIIITIIGMRDVSVGTDTRTYIEMYKYIGSNGYEGYPEPIWGLMNLIFARLGLDHTVFQLFVAIITIGLFTKEIIKESRAPMMSIYLLLGLYYVFYAMNVSRQILALSIVFVAYGQLERDRIIRCIILIVIATGVHYISILSIVVIWVRRLFFSRQTLILLLASSIVLGIAFSESIMVHFLSPILGNYADYLVSKGTNGFRTSGRLYLAIVLCLFWTTLFIIILMTAKDLVRSSIWFKILFVGLIVSNLTLRLELGLRISMIFNIVQLIVYPLYVYNNKIKQRRMGFYLVIMFISAFYFLFLSNNSAGILPYKMGI